MGGGAWVSVCLSFCVWPLNIVLCADGAEMGCWLFFLCVLACKYLVFQLKTSFFFLKNGTIGYKNSRLDNHVTCRENISLLDLRRPF